MKTFFKLGVMVLYTIVNYPIYFLGWILLCWNRGLAFRFRCRMIGWWAALFCWLLGMRVEQIGAPPKGAFIMVSNHLGYIDILLLLRAVPAWFISKSDVASWPVIGLMCRTAHVLFINRELMRDLTRMNAAMAQKLDAGQGILFFPEGTSTRGLEVQRFKPSLLALAVDRQLPVHMAVISYKTAPGEPPASEAVCWWGDMGFGEHFAKLLKLKRFKARLEFLPTPLIADDRKVLGESLRAAIAARFIPND